MSKAALCLACCAFAGSVASASDFEAIRTGRQVIFNVVHVDNTASGGSYNATPDAGTFSFEYTDTDGLRGSGQFAGGQTFYTFCAELERAMTDNRAYDVIPISAGPNPSTFEGEGPYDAADEAEVNAVIAAAARLGWIGWDLAPTETTTNALRAAVQIGIWRVLFDNSEFTVLNANVAAALATLESEAASQPDALVPGLRLMSNQGSQDMLYVLDDQPPELVCDAEVIDIPTYSPCDWNQDGVTNVADLMAFMAAYDRRKADFNGDGVTDCRDLREFLACYRDASCGQQGGGHGGQGQDDDVKLFQISFHADDDGGVVTYDAYIETDCEQIPVFDGQLVEIRCIDGRGHNQPECGSELTDDRLIVTASEARLVVIARDSAGNEAECGKVLCEPEDDGHDCHGGHGDHGHGGKDCGGGKGHDGHGGKDCGNGKGNDGHGGRDCGNGKGNDGHNGGGKGGNDHGNGGGNGCGNKGGGRGR